jgi:pimeloyl-ACP methyl ester carboxylesterase
MTTLTHRFVQTNGIRMHIAEQGAGPLVILCHGFPECWYSWRHQLSALAAAGFHAVAPDQRGFGQTDCPESITAYEMFQLCGDIVGLVQALGETRAIIVGHDFGSPVAYRCALLRPDMFHAVALLSVPFLQRSWQDIQPTKLMRLLAGEQIFYQEYFQTPGIADAELNADPRKTLLMMLYALSGDPPAEKRARPFLTRSEGFLDTLSLPDTLPPWLSEQDLDVFAHEFERTGFSGGLNWYRNIDRAWECTPFLAGATLPQPTLFIGGERDSVVAIFGAAINAMETTVPRLYRKVLLPGAGHWLHQERPAEVNALLIEFLASLS